MALGDWYLIHDMNPEFDGKFGYNYMDNSGDSMVDLHVPEVGHRRCLMSRLEPIHPSVGDLLTAMYRQSGQSRM